MDISGYADLVEVGRGASAAVYRGRQVAFDRVVAVKVLTASGLDDDARRRFRRECKAIGNLGWHPHVVSVFDAGVTPSGNPYLVMDYLPSGSLAHRLRVGGPLSERDVVAIGVQVADALDAAHRAGVLHRDVKPGNILSGHFGEAKLADFGIAAITSANTSVTDALAGTLSFMAPELLRGDRATPASDVYSLGSTMFALLVGRTAFSSVTDESPIASLMRVANDPLPDLRAEGISDAVATVIERTMAKDPAGRVPSAQKLLLALQNVAVYKGWERQPTYADRAPVEAPPVTGRAGPSSEDPSSESAAGPTSLPPVDDSPTVFPGPGRSWPAAAPADADDRPTVAAAPVGLPDEASIAAGQARVGGANPLLLPPVVPGAEPSASPPSSAEFRVPEVVLERASSTPSSDEQVVEAPAAVPSPSGQARGDAGRDGDDDGDDDGGGEGTAGPRRRRLAIVAAIVAVLALVGGGLLLAGQRGDDGEQLAASGDRSTATADEANATTTERATVSTTTAPPPTASASDIATANPAGSFVGSMELAGCDGFTEDTPCEEFAPTGITITCPSTGCQAEVWDVTIPLAFDGTEHVGEASALEWDWGCGEGADRTELMPTLGLYVRTEEADFRDDSWQSSVISGTYTFRIDESEGCGYSMASFFFRFHRET